MSVRERGGVFFEATPAFYRLCQEPSGKAILQNSLACDVTFEHNYVVIWFHGEGHNEMYKKRDVWVWLFRGSRLCIEGKEISFPELMYCNYCSDCRKMGHGSSAKECPRKNPSAATFSALQFMRLKYHKEHPLYKELVESNQRPLENGRTPIVGRKRSPSAPKKDLQDLSPKRQKTGADQKENDRSPLNDRFRSGTDARSERGLHRGNKYEDRKDVGRKERTKDVGRSRTRVRSRTASRSRSRSRGRSRTRSPSASQSSHRSKYHSRSRSRSRTPSRSRSRSRSPSKSRRSHSKSRPSPSKHATTKEMNRQSTKAAVRVHSPVKYTGTLLPVKAPSMKPNVPPPVHLPLPPPRYGAHGYAPAPAYSYPRGINSSVYPPPTTNEVYYYSHEQSHPSSQALYYADETMYYPSAVPVTQHSEQMTGLVPNVTNQSGDPLLNDSHKLTDESCKEKEQEKEKELGETSDQEDEATLDKETGAASGKEQFTIALNTQ